MSAFSYSVGNRIRALRKQRGWTQEQLAEKANLHYSYLSSMERGERNVSIDSLEKVINALKINPMQIFNFMDTEVLEGTADKESTLQAINALLQVRNTDEVKMVYRILIDMLETFNGNSNNTNNST
ncbi:helix-turn-helix domain-containing protein [Paenibacillus radicis (ex Gao et al. 2016)]|uniref:Transcriptional regulator n=1 Tax=Paenibacillus radicis (ex Gao et al. 2016) TaxID=1737354 RepID=A0A917HKH5_9BACL|nr:helix-turn-helix transcriptional regulator [Paenibacillus radicis (ex Gao et al. 2016)]GGG81993.1 transcriptional regulator [Paenibacillus radicis (ex Gao et al. 2016)]